MFDKFFSKQKSLVGLDIGSSCVKLIELKPVGKTGTEFKLKVDLFISALGYQPEKETGEAVRQIKLTAKGLVETKKDGVSTSHPQIFAGGDIVRGPALVVEAVADGKAAGKNIASMLAKTKKLPVSCRGGK